MNSLLDAAGASQPRALDGKSMLPVLLGRLRHHKKYAYGLQTTRGINAGPPHYGIRSIRSARYRLIWNLDEHAEFYNGIGKSEYFKEWMSRADAGDSHAEFLVDRYFRRPQWELYDIKNDPDQLSNLAGSPEHADAEAELRKELLAWMESQGDEGQATELRALERMPQGARRECCPFIA